MSSLTVQTAPAKLPVTIEQAMEYVRLQDDADRNELNWLVGLARDMFENSTGRVLITTTFDLTMSAFEDALRLPRIPVQSIEEIAYYDTDNVEQTLTVGDYTILEADDWRARVHRQYTESWPATYNRPDAVRVQFRAGYGDDESDVDKRCQLAVLVLVSHYWVNRDTVITGTIATELPWMLKSMLNHLRPNWLAGVA